MSIRCNTLGGLFVQPFGPCHTYTLARAAGARQIGRATVWSLGPVPSTPEQLSYSERVQRLIAASADQFPFLDGLAPAVAHNKPSFATT